MNPWGLQDRQPTDNASSSSSSSNTSERERIRGRMKMVIGQLEGILQELKEVAKELRQVVSQIDKLTSDFEFDLEPDDWTTATVSSTSSSEKGGGIFELGHLDFMTSDILSDSWEFCSFLEASTPSDSGDGSEQQQQQQQQGRQPDYRLMNGGLPIPNGPRIETPDSSSEEAFSSAPISHKAQHQRTPGTRERVRFSDKILYHALCCDDEEVDNGQLPEDPPEEPNEVVVHKAVPATKATPRRVPAPHLSSAQQRKLTRNSSTQTVSDKSTQTVLPYISGKQKIKGKN